MLRFLGFAILFLLLANPAAAQNADDMSARLQVALKQNDRALALDIARDLYDISDKADDDKSAGYLAYVKAGILEYESDHSEAAKAYDQCAKHYKKIEGHAQSIQCQYRSALAFLSGSKQGQAIDALKSTVKSLETLGQDKSDLAAQVYFTLSDEILPAKLDRSRQAIRNRRASAEYAEKSLIALAATGQAESDRYVSALFTKALALEDAEEFEDATKTYMETIALYKSMPDHSPELLKNMQSRLSIARFGATGEGNKDTTDVRLKNGDVVALKIKKKKAIKYPRINKNQMVDGARVRAKIYLLNNGKVDRIEILESMPSEEFGVAFKDAVKTWEFQPPKEFMTTDIPPFEYSMVFYVRRR